MSEETELEKKINAKIEERTKVPCLSTDRFFLMGVPIEVDGKMQANIALVLLNVENNICISIDFQYLMKTLTSSKDINEKKDDSRGMIV